jgi:hypothetical protein
MEELLKQMREEMDQYILVDKDSHQVLNLVEVEVVIPIIEKYIKLAYDH